MRIGEAEADGLAGKWFKQNPGKREKIFLATKFANCADADGNRWVDSTPEYCRKACEKSLQRLGVDSIDLCMPDLIGYEISPC